MIKRFKQTNHSRVGVFVEPNKLIFSHQVGQHLIRTDVVERDTHMIKNLKHLVLAQKLSSCPTAVIFSNELLTSYVLPTTRKGSNDQLLDELVTLLHEHHHMDFNDFYHVINIAQRTSGSVRTYSVPTKVVKDIQHLLQGVLNLKVQSFHIEDALLPKLVCQYSDFEQQTIGLIIPQGNASLFVVVQNGRLDSLHPLPNLQISQGKVEPAHLILCAEQTATIIENSLVDAALHQKMNLMVYMKAFIDPKILSGLIKHLKVHPQEVDVQKLFSNKQTDLLPGQYIRVQDVISRLGVLI